jgi:hypothetical protein
MSGGKHSLISPSDTFAAFHTEEGFRAVAARLGTSPNTLRKWWVSEFGQEAFDARGKALQAKAAAAVGRATAGKTRTITEITEPCAVCSQPVVLNLIQRAKLIRVICAACDEAERGVDRHCPVCGFGCAGAKGLSGHMTRPQYGDPSAHALYLRAQEEATWEGKIEDRDFVVCQECGIKGLSLGNHIKLHNFTASEYYSKYPSASLASSVTESNWMVSIKASATDRAYKWDRETLLKFADEKGKIIVAEAAQALNASSGTVLIYCRSLGLPTRNRLAWQRVVLDQASKALGASYVWEWSDPRIVNPTTGRVLNYDGFFPALNLIVEAHGDQHFRYAEAWHGTLEHFHELRERDTFKKRRAEELGFRVLVVRPTDPISDLSFWRQSLGGSLTEPLDAVERVFTSLRQDGFPEIVSSETELKKSLTRLQGMNPYVDSQMMLRPYSSVGTTACASFFPLRYHARHKGAKSAWEAWHDDESFRKAIRLQLDSGHPTVPHRVLRALVMYHRTPSIFRPVVAKYVCQTFARDGVVWDPCMGYGGRLLGALSAGVSLYIGTDIEPSTVTGNQLIVQQLEASDRCRLTQHRAENFDPGVELDLVFTSPPYFDLESYGSSEVHYGSPQGWVRDFLRPVMRCAVERLKSGGHLVLNLPIKPVCGMRLDLEAVAEGQVLGLMEGPTFWMPVRTFKGTLKGEPLLVWRKC